MARTRARKKTDAAPPLFRLRQRADREGELLGYEWIEVLAIEPWRFMRDPEVDRAGVYDIRCYYVCRTPVGIDRITSHDLWHAIEELQEYEEG